MISSTAATNVSTWQSLRRVLDRQAYDLLVYTVRGPEASVQPWLRSDAAIVRQRIAALPAPARTILHLLYLGEEVPGETVVDCLGGDLAEKLLLAGLLQATGGTMATDQYALIPFRGWHFLVTLPVAGGAPRGYDAYLGPDSFLLADHLDRSRQPVTVLDLCAGSGILGQVAASFARRTVATELCAEAIHLSRVNALLNGVADRWSIRQGDLWAPVSGERFDLIVSNPPFVPIPDGLPFPLFGRAGENGMEFLDRILNRLPDHLTTGGKAQIVFENPGGEAEPIVCESLRAFTANHPDWSLHLFLHDRIRIQSTSFQPLGETAARLHGQGAENRAEEIAGDVFRMYANRGWSHVYRALLLVDRDPAGERGLTLIQGYSAPE
jgi:hypothetical protein